MNKTDTSTCDGCQKTVRKFYTLDQWAIVDKKYYCRTCQKERKIGWYEKR